MRGERCLASFGNEQAGEALADTLPAGLQEALHSVIGAIASSARPRVSSPILVTA